MMDENITLQYICNLIENNQSWWLIFGQYVDAIINSFVGVIFIILFLLFSIRWLEKKFKINKINYITEKVTNFIIDNTPSVFLRSILLQLFDIQAEIFILLPKTSIRNYQHLGYQLNGLNRFLEKEKNLEYRERIKIILINNFTIETTDEDMSIFIQSLSTNKRYIIIATMSDIFDRLLIKIPNKFKEKKHCERMIRIIGTLASQSERYKDYEAYKNIIRLSPPDFDEAKKAASNIVIKLISNFCPNITCSYHKKNNIILISSNSYGDAVKKSFSKFFSKYKEEFDTNTNFHLNADELKKKTDRFTYHYDTQKGIVEDEENDTSFKQLFEEKIIDNAINTIFIIGYEPNVSNILKKINEYMREKRFDSSEFSILISATVSVDAWRESIIETINSLEMKESINEINFIEIQYPKFQDDSTYNSKNIYFRLFEIDYKKDILKPSELRLKKEEINKIIYKKEINYINGFIYMSLKLVYKIDKNWDTNLLSAKWKLFNNKNIDGKDVTGLKILSSGDSINHFQIQKLKWKKI